MPNAPKTHRPSHRPDRAATDRLYNRRRRADPERDDSFYASAAWRRFRSWFLGANPLCRACEARGWSVAAAHVHHKLQRRLYPHLAFDADNCEALCASCHTRESNRERREG